MKLNLEARTLAEQKVKAYLEANASAILAEKINNGVRIQKDGKQLLNKKTLAGFMQYACEEARKQADKGARSACIDDETVYGWAIHYFEEDSIEGTLFNEDGTEYKASMSKTLPAPKQYTPPMSKPKPQLSLFDMVAANNQNESVNPEKAHTNEGPTEELLRADPVTGEILSEEEMRQFDGDIDEHIPTISHPLSVSSSDCKSDEIPLKQQPTTSDEEDELDLSAFDAEAVAILSEIFVDEIELR